MVLNRTLINKKNTEGLDSFKILRNVDQTSQTSTDQSLPDPPKIMNATKTPRGTLLANKTSSRDATKF